MKQTREQKYLQYSFGNGSSLAWANDTTAKYSYPLSAWVNNYWSCGSQLADIPPLQSATLGLYLIACKILLISHSNEGRRLSWNSSTVLCGQEAIESAEQDTVLNMDVHSKLHVLYGGTKVVQHTPPSKTGPGLKGTAALYPSRVYFVWLFQRLWYLWYILLHLEKVSTPDLHYKFIQQIGNS